MSLEIALTAIANAMNRIADALENNSGEASDNESPNASAPATSSGKRGRKSKEPAQTVTEAANVTPSLFAEPTAATDANPAKSYAPAVATSTAPTTAGTPPADNAAPNAASATISPEQEKALRKPLNDKVFELASGDMKACQGFLAQFNVKRAGEIPLARLDEAMAAITKLLNPAADASSLI